MSCYFDAPKNSAWATHGEHYFLSTARAPLMIALSIAYAGAPFEPGADRSDFANFDRAALCATSTAECRQVKSGRTKSRRHHW
jgi:hypothetical protein